MLNSYLESIKSYFNLVLAGLAGSPHMISCTLLVLSKLAYEFHGEHYIELRDPTLLSVVCRPVRERSGQEVALKCIDVPLL